MERAYKMLEIVQSYAPNSTGQLSMTIAYNNMQAAGCTEDEIVRAFADILVDGLRHGNWPWRASHVNRT